MTGPMGKMKEGKGRESWIAVAPLSRVDRLGLRDPVTAEQRPEGSDRHWLDLTGKEEHSMLRDHHMQRPYSLSLLCTGVPAFSFLFLTHSEVPIVF